MDYEAIQELVRRAQVERGAALGDAIGEAFGGAWLAIARAASKVQALVMRRSHA